MHVSIAQAVFAKETSARRTKVVCIFYHSSIRSGVSRSARSRREPRRKVLAQTEKKREEKQGEEGCSARAAARCYFLFSFFPGV